MMRKIAILIFFIGFSQFVNAQTMQESGVTIEYEFNDKTLIAEIFIDGLTDKYKIDLLMRNEVDPEYGNIGIFSTDYYYKNGYDGTIYWLKSNDIDYICRTAIAEDIKDERRSPKVKNKSKVIIALLRRILVEAMETGKLNLTNN